MTTYRVTISKIMDGRVVGRHSVSLYYVYLFQETFLDINSINSLHYYMSFFKNNPEIHRI